MVRISDNGPDWKKAKCLSAVNHTTKTIHHHHHNQEKFSEEKKKKFLGQREGRIEILQTHKKKTRNRERKREKREKKMTAEFCHMTAEFCTCNKLTKQYIINCSELRRLQFSETNIFNVF